MSTLWSVINRTDRGDVLSISPRVDVVSLVDNTRMNISADVLGCNLTRDYRAGVTGSLRMTRRFADGEFWASHLINPSLDIRTRHGLSRVKLGALGARNMQERYSDVSVTLVDVLGWHRQPQLRPFNTAPDGVTPTPTQTSPEAALAKLRVLTSGSKIVGALDHRGFEPTTLLNPNPDISGSDAVDVRSYAAGSELICELERLLEGIGWRPPWTTRRGLLTSEPYCSPCDVEAREGAEVLPFGVVFEESFAVDTNLSAPNVLRVLDSNGDASERRIAAGERFSAERLGRVVPYLERARNPASNIDQFWASLRAPRRRVSFSCAAPGVFWHRDVFKLPGELLVDAVCVVSRWSLDVVSGAYTVEADVCGG